MATFFNTAAEVTTLATYKRTLKTAITKIGDKREPFAYYDSLEFDSGSPRAAVIPGKLEKAVTTALDKKGRGPARGFCTFSPEDGLYLMVTRGKVDKKKAVQTLGIAGVNCEVTVLESSDPDDGRDDELAALGSVGAVTAAKAAFGERLEAHLAGKTPQDREDHARRALQMGETATNATKVGGEPHAHALSAHGPGADQTPRIVGGYRADEVAAGGGPAAMTPLNATATLPQTQVPSYRTVGNDPSNISSEFASATAMLAAVEEAFAQATQLQSRIADEITAATDDRAVLGEAAVKGTLQTLVATRKALDAAKAQLEAAKTQGKRGEVQKLITLVKQRTGELEKASASFKAAKLVAMEARPAPDISTAADGRFVRNVQPGLATGSQMSTTSPALASGAPLTDDVMQSRYDNTTKTEGLTDATVVLDPAFVTGPDGVRRRAGWQAQTAFPTAGEAVNKDLSAAEFEVTKAKERLAKAETVVAAAMAERDSKTALRDAARGARRAAVDELGRAEGGQNDHPLGTPQRTVADRRVADATEAVEARKVELAAADQALARVEAIHVVATRARDAAKVATADKVAAEADLKRDSATRDREAARGAHKSAADAVEAAIAEQAKTTAGTPERIQAEEQLAKANTALGMRATRLAGAEKRLAAATAASVAAAQSRAAL